MSPRQLDAAARSLGAEVAHLAEDIQIELRRLPNAEHLLNDAREAAEGAEHLAASVDQGVDLAHAIKDFQEFDKAWHHVSGQLRTARVTRSLQRGVMRVAEADASLHRLLGVPAPVDIQEVRRLAESLAQAAQHLLEDTQQALSRSARGEQIVQFAEDFAEAAEHFSESIAQGGNVEHARKDFAAVDEAWQSLSDRIYALSPYRFEHLQEAASRVAPIVGQLADTLGVAPEPQTSLPPTAFRFDRAQGHGTFAKLSPADRQAAIAQRTCPVTGDLLGEMGVPIKVRVQGRDVFVCCKGCVAKVQREPEKYLPNIQP